MFLFRFATSSQPNEAFDCVKWTFVKVAFLRRAHHWVWLMFCFCKRNTGVEFLKVFSVRCQRGRGQGDRGLEGGGGWVGYYPTGVGWIMACPEWEQWPGLFDTWNGHLSLTYGTKNGLSSEKQLKMISRAFQTEQNPDCSEMSCFPLNINFWKYIWKSSRSWRMRLGRKGRHSFKRKPR